MMMRIKLDNGAFMPVRGHLTDAGLDLLTPIPFTVPAGGSAVIDTGVHVELPNGTAGFLKSKSGLNVKYDITSDGVIDEGYTGSIVAKLYNHGTRDKTFEAGEKITQLVILPIVLPGILEVCNLNSTDRGDNGFGSTGR